MPDSNRELNTYHARVLEAANRGAQNAIETHRRMGRAIVIWRDGEVVKLEAQDIPPRPLPGDAE